MPACPGIKSSTNSKCGTYSIYRCKKCGHVGCANNGCTNQAFSSYQCLRCGAPSSRESF
jgi:DNA-directed RNA polymerase subunit RPC12/RpoP